MRLEGIETGDIVKVSIGGRTAYGEVLEIRAGTVHFEPITRSSWRHASAHQVVRHWRLAGRRGGDRAAAQPLQQLSLPLHE